MDNFESFIAQNRKANRNMSQNLLKHCQREIASMAVNGDGTVFDINVANHTRASLLKASSTAVTTWLNRNQVEGGNEHRPVSVNEFKELIGYDRQMYSHFKLVHDICHVEGEKYNDKLHTTLQYAGDLADSLIAYINTLY